MASLLSLNSQFSKVRLDEENIITVEECEDDFAPTSNQPPPGRRKVEEGDRRGRNGRRMRVKPRRSRHLESEETAASPKNVPLKNAVMMLNEMYPPPGAPQYKVISMTGTPNNPTFTMTCSIGDKTFSGSGRSKKEAKLNASQLALHEMFGKDFSGGGGETEQAERKDSPGQEPEIKDWLELEGKNPVSILNELYPGVIFSLISSDGPSHAPVYQVRASLANLTYDGVGSSKKEAKLHASKALLAQIHRVGFDPITGGLKSPSPTKETEESQSHSWADKVSRLVREEYDRLFDGTIYYKRKVLAGVVLDVAGVSSVICLSTGTKCINGEMMSLAGQSLNDCHAEVVVRRCLVSWLYSRLEEVFLSGKSEVLEPGQTGYRLRTGVTLHLFISTAPCGDARIFSLHEQPAEGSNVLTSAPGRMGEGNRGKLRIKIESGMGTVPLPERETVQTWDGVMSGERLLTMACSDKILSWNVTGCQGSLLSHWLAPVYFSTLSIGSKFHPSHLSRAVHGRVGGHLQLPRGFRLNRVPVLATTSPEARQPSKAQDHSVNWVVGGQPEVVLATTGRTSLGESSRLCKRALADRFLKLCSLPAGLQSFRTELSSHSIEQISNLRYDELKSLAIDHVEAKQCLKEKLVAEDCGRWVVKPVEQDEFMMDILSLRAMMDEEMWKLIQNTPLPSSEESDVQISSIEPEHGVEFESPEENKLNTPHSTVTHKMVHKWAVIKLSGLQEQKQIIEDSLKSEGSEFLVDPPQLKQLCIFERNGVIARVIVDSVRDSGFVKCHSVEDGKRLTAFWKKLRHFPSSVLQYPPHCLTVRLNCPHPPDYQTVKIIYLGDKKGYPLVEMIRVSANLLSDSDKTRGHPMLGVSSTIVSDPDKTGADISISTQDGTNDSPAIPSGITEETQVEELKCKVQNWALAYKNLSNNFQVLFERFVSMNQELRNSKLKMAEKGRELQRMAEELSSKQKIEEELKTQIDSRVKELEQKRLEIRILKELSWGAESS